MRLIILKVLKKEINNIHLPNSEWYKGYKRILKINNVSLVFSFFLNPETGYFEI